MREVWSMICTFINMSSLKEVLDSVICLIYPRLEGDDTPVSGKEYASIAMIAVVVVLYVIAT